ncbi:hypothetical protein ACJ41O_009707 [Fusarium nematophilum]
MENKARRARLITPTSSPLSSSNIEQDPRNVPDRSSLIYDIQLRGPTGDWQRIKADYDSNSAYSFINPITTKQLEVMSRPTPGEPAPSSGLFKDMKPKEWAHNVGLRSVKMGVRGIAVDFAVSAEQTKGYDIVIGKEVMEQIDKSSTAKPPGDAVDGAWEKLDRGSEFASLSTTGSESSASLARNYTPMEASLSHWPEIGASYNSYSTNEIPVDGRDLVDVDHDFRSSFNYDAVASGHFADLQQVRGITCSKPLYATGFGFDDEPPDLIQPWAEGSLRNYRRLGG